VDIIWNGLVRNFRHLYDLLFSVDSQLSVTSLACAFFIASGFLIIRRGRQGRSVRLRALMRALFPRRIVRSRRRLPTSAIFFSTCSSMPESSAWRRCRTSS
jgi:hypothetical protein